MTPSPTKTPLVSITGLTKTFDTPRGPLHALADVGFDIPRGAVVGLVGESGSGKTTVGRCLLRLIAPTSGSVRFDGIELTSLDGRALKAMRRRMQIIFQDPFSSLNPRMRVRDIIGEALIAHNIGRNGRDRRDRIAALLEEVGLSPDQMGRFPHEFSGGQRQRIGIARALAVEPEFIVADESVSALDVSVQAQILNLMQDLRDRRGLTILFIAHDLSVVEYLCDEVVVLYLGRVAERGVPQHVIPVRVGRKPRDDRLVEGADVGRKAQQLGARQPRIHDQHARQPLHDDPVGLHACAGVGEDALGDLDQHDPHRNRPPRDF